MKSMHITSVPGFEEWRIAARECLNARIPPDQILWNGHDHVEDLFQSDMALPQTSTALTVPKDFLSLAEATCCHKDGTKYALLYKILWRLAFENRNLLKISTDDDILKLNALVKAVRRDAYKIKAFLRFREIKHEAAEYFVAWHEPEHYSLERVLPFFQTRFRNMKWSILTPYRAAHWNGAAMVLEDNPDPSLYPKDDQVEQYWLGYYANIFNPARLKTDAMRAQMPKKYWKTMPETALIPDLIKSAATRTDKMIAKGNKG